ncbi:YdcF family protein [Vibrio vulnificus]|nr:YdcF family protein [Vibrio vulnificus]
MQRLWYCVAHPLAGRYATSRGFGILKKLIFIFGLILSISVSAIFLDSRESSGFIAEVGIVYGNKVELDGKPSLRLASRLDAGLNLYKNGQVKILFVSGGIGKEGFNEAEVMKQYLVNNGVPVTDIIIDSKGDNTHLTNRNLGERFNVSTSVVAISQAYHVSRAKLSLRNLGFVTVYGYSSNYVEARDVYSYLREIPAWLKYKLLRL